MHRRWANAHRLFYCLNFMPVPIWLIDGLFYFKTVQRSTHTDYRQTVRRFYTRKGGFILKERKHGETYARLGKN